MAEKKIVVDMRFIVISEPAGALFSMGL